MAARTATQTGNWSSSSTWGGSAAPGNGDTADLSTFTVTVDVDTTVGTSPASGGTAAIVIGTAGKLIIAAGKTLTCRGPVTQGNGSAEFGAGSVFEFDASQATTPMSQKYAWTASAFSRGNRMLTANGTSGSHVTIRSNASGGNGYFSSGTSTNDSLWFNFTYVDWLRVGDTTNACANPNPSTDATVNTFSFNTFTSCGGLVWASGGTNTSWSITDCVWASGNYKNLSDGNTKPTPLSLSVGRGLIGSATRNVLRCVFDERPNIVGCGATYTDCYFHKGVYSNSNFQPLWTLLSNSFIRQIYDYDTVHGDVTDCYVIKDTWPQTASVSGTATAGGARTLTDSGKSWTVNQFQSVSSGTSYAVLITGGTGSGQYRQIISNTATVLTLTTGWLTNPDATSTYEIYHELGNPHYIGPTTMAGETGTATGGSTTTLANTGKSWTTNQWSGYLVTITGGTGSGQTGTIQSNTGTVLTVPTWAVAPDATSTYTISVSYTWTRLAFEYNGADPNGDCFLHMDSNQANYTILNALVLPNAGLDNTGTLMTTYKRSSARVGTLKLRHCTYFTGGQSAAICESSTGSNADPLTEFLSNLAWCDQTGSYYNSALGPYVLCTSGDAGSPGTGPQTTITAGSVDYNGKRNNLTGYAGGGYNVNLSQSAGAHDVSGDPAFVSPYRNFASWAVSRGSVSTTLSGQTVDGLSYLKADPTLTASSLLPYIRAGFAPTNTTFRNAGSDGVTIGAVEGVFASGNGFFGFM